MIPQNSPYAFLNNEPAPKHLLEAIKLFGTKETQGSGNNPVIMEWANECNLGRIYKQDSMPWCGLFVAVCFHRADRPILTSYDTLRALKWAGWGVPIMKAMLGDLLIFQREGGGHVGFYVGEDSHAYHVLGGNQGDKVSVVRIAKNRCVGITRPAYNKQPENIRQINLNVGGQLSSNES